MVEQDELQIGIGTEEAVTLKPARVTIKDVIVGEFGAKKAKKVVCQCIHPDASDAISISAVKHEYNGKLEVIGLWMNKDSQGKIRKASGLASFLRTMKCNTIAELKGKEADAIIGDKGYLCFKAY